MLTLVHSSSGSSLSCRRAATGISSVCACLSTASSAMRTAFGIISIRTAEIQRSNDDRSAARVPTEQGSTERDEHRQAESDSRLVGIHRTHLQGELVLPRIAVTDQLLRPRIEVLLADPDALPEGRRCRLVEDLHAAAGPARDLDPIQARPGLGAAGADSPDLPRRKQIALDRLVAVQFWRR